MNKLDTLKKFISEHKSVRQFCLQYDINQGNISSILNEKRVFDEIAAKNIEDKIFTVTGKRIFNTSATLIPIDSEILAIPVHEATLGASIDDKNPEPKFDKLTDETVYIADPEFCRRYLNKDKLEAFIVDGDSMEYTIQKGAYVVLDRKMKDIIDNRVYAITYGDEQIARVKRLRKVAKGLLIISDNKMYGDELIEPGSGIIINIIGRVVYVANKL